MKRRNKFSKFIEHILVCLPLLFLGITSAYVVFNKNAKDSYSDSYIEDLTQVNNSDLVIQNANYMVSFNSSNTSLGNIAINPLTTTLNDYISLEEGQYIKQFVLMIDNGTPRIQIILNDDTTTRIMNWGNVCPTFYFTLDTMSLNYFNTSYSSIYLITEKSNTLNNVLPYAMGEFNKLGFGKIPFTSFFTSIFMNGETNVYVEFVNSYLNYFLFVEVCYFIPSVLYWFIHFGEDVVNRFSRKDY